VHTSKTPSRCGLLLGPQRGLGTLNEIGQQLTCAVYGDCPGETVSETWALSDRRELPVWSRGYSILMARVRSSSPSLGGANRQNGWRRAECALASTLPVSDDTVGVTGQAGSSRCVGVVCGVGGGGVRGGAPRSSPSSKSLGKTSEVSELVQNEGKTVRWYNYCRAL
jgi:hypothetical protein